MAKQLIANSTPGETINVRLGWEFNGAGWNTSSAVGQPDNYIAAFRNFVTVARSLSDKFVFEWCPAGSTADMNPELAYPGDAYVDLIGIDFYWYTEYHGSDPVKAWNHFVNSEYGLQWQQDFAAAHGKQTAVAEWGLNSDSALFVQLASDWFASHNMVYQSYWDSNAAFQGMLSGGQYPSAAALFQSLYSDPVTTSAPVVSIPIYGDANANVLPGTDGADTMAGKAGNDVYTVNASGDVIIEAIGEGTDEVRASVSYKLAANVENLQLLDAGLTGEGNELANQLTGSSGADILMGLAGDDVLTGNAGNDRLDGGVGNDTLYGGDGDDSLDGAAGNDVMEGGAGNDTYTVDSTTDLVREVSGAGTDAVLAAVSYTLSNYVENITLTGGALNATGNALANAIQGNALANVLNGSAGNDRLVGMGGNDSLVGGSGADAMVGGTGDDTYQVENAGDQVIEQAGEGTDTVNAFIDYQLSANLEILYLQGSVGLAGIGNDSDNQIFGTNAADRISGLGGADVLRGYAGDDRLSGGAANDSLYGAEGNDLLDGGAGADTMDGGIGNDSYVVDSAGDQVLEFSQNGQGGVDTVTTSIDYMLGSNVESLVLAAGALKGTGNALANSIIGNEFANVLNGLAGDDVLTGGLGADRFVFDKASGKDRITDFSSGDSIALDAYIAAGIHPSILAAATGALIDLGSGNTILLTGVGVSHLQVTSSGYTYI